jgi:predicted RNA-binding protein with PIN domain
MLYLIDGYNLLHAMGVMRPRMGRTGLERARGRLLGLLAGVYEAEASCVTVVFDAAAAPRDAEREQHHRGITVRFAVDEEEADDLIEHLIRKASAPKQLTVVSDDHRIQQAATRRRCNVMRCEAYLNWLDSHRRRQAEGKKPTDVPAKPEGVSRSETQRWLREFADLADDPQMKELFEPFDFEKGDRRE